MKINKEKKLKIYNELVNKHYNDLFRYAYKITNNKAIAEDVLQETLLRAWNGLESLKEINKAKSWLITILKRENIRRVYKDKVNVNDSYDDFEYLLEDTVCLDEEMDKNIILRNIQELKEKYREPLILQVFLGLSVEEISKKIGLNENTVSTRLFRAKSLLEKKLSQKIKKENKVNVQYDII